MNSLLKPKTGAKFRLPQLHSKEFETAITTKKEKERKQNAITLCFLLLFCLLIPTAQNDQLFLFFPSTIRKFDEQA